MECKNKFPEGYIENGMSINKLIEIYLLEEFGDEYNNIRTQKERYRKKLEKILQNLKINSILQNPLNRDKNKNVYSIYQCIFFRRLLLDYDRNEEIIKKVNRGKIIEITETEIEEFCQRLKEDFELYIEFYRTKNKLEKEYDESDVSEISGSVRAIYEKDIEEKEKLEELYGTPQPEDFLILKYLKMKRQTEDFLINMKSILKNKCELDKRKKIMVEEIWKNIEQVFHLETISDMRIETLDRYENPIFGVVDLPLSILYNEEELTDELKLFLLHEFDNDLKILLSKWEKYVELFPRMFELQRKEFVNEKTDIKPERNQTLVLVKRTERNLKRKQKARRKRLEAHKKSKNTI